MAGKTVPSCSKHTIIYSQMSKNMFSINFNSCAQGLRVSGEWEDLAFF
jgi:hypothetical protein